MGKGKRTDDGILRVLYANAGVWLTTREVGWIMSQLCGYSANGKSICRRMMGFEYDSPELLNGGRVESLRLDRKEAQYLKCKYKYRWVQVE